MKYLFLSLFITSCSVRATDNSDETTLIAADFNVSEQKTAIHVGSSGHEVKNSMQVELADSQLLKHIKNVFYKSKTGHLYERTIGTKEIKDHLVDYEYFNGTIPQELDPLTFRPLNGWYAADKNAVYYYRPVSGGMLNSKIEEADLKTFKILKEHYRYAQDKHHFYQDAHIIENYNPQNTAIQRDERGKPIALSNKTGIYRLE